MKRIFWKELMEARYFPIWLCVLAILVLASDYSVLTSGVYLPIGSVVVGIAAGCSSIASEFGNGTIRFLSSLPVNRKGVWMCKFAAAACISIVTVGLLLGCGLFDGSGAISHPVRTSYYNGTLSADIAFAAWWLVPASLVFFGLACSIFTSTLVDRPLTAVILSFVTAIALPSVFLRLTLGAETALGFGWSIFNYVVLDAISVGLLIASYFGFSRGRDAGLMRPVVLAPAIATGSLIAVATAVMVVGLLWPQPTTNKLNCSVSDQSPTDWSQPGAVPTTIWQCPYAPIGQTYVLEVNLQVPAFEAAKVVSSDPNLSASLRFPLAVFDILPEAVVTYRAQAPVGKHHYELRVLDKAGKVVEVVLVGVTKVDPNGRVAK